MRFRLVGLLAEFGGNGLSVTRGRVVAPAGRRPFAKLVVCALRQVADGLSAALAAGAGTIYGVSRVATAVISTPSRSWTAAGR